MNTAKEPEPEKPELNVWPHEKADAGSRLVGRVAYYDPTGGQGGEGFFDVVSDDGTQYRWYMNKPGRTALNYVMRKQGLVEDDLPEARLVVRFEGWQKGKQSGRSYRDYAVGLAKYEPQPKKAKE